MKNRGLVYTVLLILMALFTMAPTIYTVSVLLSNLGDPTANKTFDIGTYDIYWDLDSGGLFGAGNYAGGDYALFAYTKVSLEGDYYLEGDFALPQLSSDGEAASPQIIYVIMSETASFRAPVALDISSGNYYAVIADSDTASGADMPAVGLLLDACASPPCTDSRVLTQGIICETDDNWTADTPIYVSDSGGLTQTVPASGSAVWGQRIGQSVNSDCILVKPGPLVGWADSP